MGRCRTSVIILGLVFLLQSQESAAQSHLTGFPSILARLQGTKTGAHLIERAFQVFQVSDSAGLALFLRWGSVSKTDSVLTRHFHPDTGQEEKVRKTNIILRKDQTEEEMIMDLAHELVHATSPELLDPYDPQLTAGKYVLNAIEGKGGEVEAVIAECRVGAELAESLAQDSNHSISRCERYFSQKRSKILVKNKVKEDFYRVGHWLSEIQEGMKNEIKLFPLLSRQSVRLYSSTGHTPYPAALLQEYRALNQVACANSRKRAQLDSQDHSLAFLAMRCQE